MWLPRRGMTSASKVNLVKAASTEKKEINIINNRKLTKSRTLASRRRIPFAAHRAIIAISKSMHIYLLYIVRRRLGIHLQIEVELGGAHGGESKRATCEKCIFATGKFCQGKGKTKLFLLCLNFDFQGNRYNDVAMMPKSSVHRAIN